MPTVYRDIEKKPKNSRTYFHFSFISLYLMISVSDANADAQRHSDVAEFSRPRDE